MSELTKDRHLQLFPDLPERAWLAACPEQRHPMCGHTASPGQGLGSDPLTDNWNQRGASDQRGRPFFK